MPQISDKRPCKKWASYGGRCVEKILAPKSKYIDTSKPGSKELLGPGFPMVWFGMVILTFTATNGCVLRNSVKQAILGGSETALSKFRQ